MKKFVIIDGNALFHRSYHALPKTLRSRAGLLTNAVHGFTGILLGILEEEKPDYIATAWDIKGPTFRKKMMVDYKATRKKTDDELIGQFPLVYGVLDAMGIPRFMKEGLEADDYLGILANELEAYEDIEVIIVTSDQDALQLVTEKVTVVAPISGYSKVKRYDSWAVKEKLGVWPQQVTDYKGLRGDSSDNIPGVPGIGAKGAAKLLEKFESLERIYEKIEEVEPERIRELLKEHEKIARLSKEVATILRENGDLGFELEACSVHSFDIDDVRSVFEELSFNTHMRRVESLNKVWDAARSAEKQESLF